MSKKQRRPPVLSDEDIDRCFAEARATIAEVRATVAPFERFAPRLLW